MRKSTKSLLLQFLVFLAFSLFFSVLPVLLGVLGDRSSYALAVFNAWYGLLPPVALLLLAYLLYRREASWLTFLGRAWMGVGTWFLLQLVLESLTTVSPLLALLSLPAKFAGGVVVRHPVGYVAFFSGWGLVAGIVVFLLGGLALYIAGKRLGNRMPGRTAGGYSRPTFVVSSVLLAVCLLLTPLSVCAVSRPAPRDFAEGAAVPTEAEIYGYIEDVYGFGPRRPGSATYHEAAAHVAAQLEEFGLDVNVEKTSFDYWEEKEWRLVLEPAGEKPTEVECYFWPYSGQTPPEGITAEMVYLGEGSEEEVAAAEVEGKVVLVSLPPMYVGWNLLKLFSFMAYDPEDTAAGNDQPYPIGWLLHLEDIYRNIEQAGAAGTVYVLEGYPDMGTFTYYAPYDGQIRSVPSLYVREEDGNMIRERLREGPLEVNLTLEASIARDGGEAVNIYAVLPGKSDANFVVSSHFDSPWASGVEDSSGTGMVLALAGYYARVPAEERQRTMVFLLTGSHFVGEASNDDFMERHRSGILADTLSIICIEHIADNWPYSQYVDPRGVFFEENPVVISLFAGLVPRYGLYRTLLFPTVTPLGVPTDAGPFSRAGFPVASNISGPVYLFDVADTLERVARDQLEPMAKLYIDFIDNLSRYPGFVLRFNINTLAILLTALLFSPLVTVGFATCPRRRKDETKYLRA